MAMKLNRSIKVVGVLVALLAVLGLAVPGYAWTHDDGFGRSHYPGHVYLGAPSYGYGYGGGHHSGWAYGYRHSGNYYPHHRSYYSDYSEPYFASGFAFSIPGFSFFFGQ